MNLNKYAKSMIAIASAMILLSSLNSSSVSATTHQSSNKTSIHYLRSKTINRVYTLEYLNKEFNVSFFDIKTVHESIASILKSKNEEAKKKADEEAKKKADEEAARKAAEEAKKKADEEAAKKAAEEAAKQSQSNQASQTITTTQTTVISNDSSTDQSVRVATQPATSAVSQDQVTSDKLYSLDDFMFLGIINWNGYKFSYYSQSVLPGLGLSIPGRHVNEDGYVVDGDGYIVLANDSPIGTTIPTPFGAMGKVYDRGTYGNHYDVYVK